jgi:hypothetical protein
MDERSHWDRVVELARISMENPVAAAVLRLHCDEDGTGSCSACTGEYSVPWPCPTVQAIEQVATKPKPVAINPTDAVKLVRMPIGGTWQWEPKEPAAERQAANESPEVDRAEPNNLKEST